MARAHAPFGEPSHEQHTIVDPDTWAVICDEHGELDDGSSFSSEADAWEEATTHDRLHAEGAFAPQSNGGTPA